MRCSHCEMLLAGLVEGTLPSALAAQVNAHVTRCDPCSALLAEVRVIDALLQTPRVLQPAPNFTFAAMAEIRAMPASRTRRFPHAAVLATYLLFAWACIGAWVFGSGTHAHVAMSSIFTAFGKEFASLATLSHLSTRLFGNVTPSVSIAMQLILIIDVLIAAALIFGYGALRPQFAAAIAARPEDS